MLRRMLVARIDRLARRLVVAAEALVDLADAIETGTSYRRLRAERRAREFPLRTIPYFVPRSRRGFCPSSLPPAPRTAVDYAGGFRDARAGSDDS